MLYCIIYLGNAKMKKAVIIGAGPAGLTAAYELLKRTDIVPIVLEAENFAGGISRTFNCGGNRMDMGGHRFFSKSDRVMNWWINILPLQGTPSKDDIILNRKIALSDKPSAPNPQNTDRVMLVRSRLSRIYYLKHFFNYPVSVNFGLIRGLGLWRMTKIGFSYFKTLLLPKRKEVSLEDFMVNRFGNELYLTFFKDYTEKIWGVNCSDIPADWGAQRIKGISVAKILADIVKKAFGKRDKSLSQKNTETSLIEQFMYPKFGPGHLWETAAEEITGMGGQIIYNAPVTQIEVKEGKVISAAAGGKKYEADYFFSSMPVKDLIKALTPSVPDEVNKVANGLIYRDFRTAGLLLKELKIKNNGKIKTVNGIVPDTWIYIQEKEVKVGRLQIFNNWSPYLVKDFSGAVWIGCEYFCFEGDELWNMPEDDFINLAVQELSDIGIIEKSNFISGCSVHVPKAYPAYFGTYRQFDLIKKYTDNIPNLYLLGRNGTHRYNNMDHSMLTAMTAVDNIIAGKTSKENIWNINSESEYHEEKAN